MNNIKYIDFRSDTVTRPVKPMLEAMFAAQVGDDVFGEDPSVSLLEEKISSMFGMESALFCPSGTMANQIAIKVHTRPMDELICDALSHVYMYEGGGIMFNSGVSVKLIQGNRGRIQASDVLDSINPDDVHYPKTRLVCLENTCNRGGGSVYSNEDIRKISDMCKNNTLSLHLDGARIFNALIATNTNAREIGMYFDSISVCLSKGLGAPVGSVLLGNRDFIREAKRVRKVLGGGMRQAGYLAAAGIYALDNHIQGLKEDHIKAAKIGQTLNSLPYVKSTMPVDTNIVVFTLQDDCKVSLFLEKLKENHILAMPFGKQSVRMVTHLDISNEDLKLLLHVLENLKIV